VAVVVLKANGYSEFAANEAKIVFPDLTYNLDNRSSPWLGTRLSPMGILIPGDNSRGSQVGPINAMAGGY
jgi:hypothetical protein